MLERCDMFLFLCEESVNLSFVRTKHEKKIPVIILSFMVSPFLDELDK